MDVTLAFLWLPLNGPFILWLKNSSVKRVVFFSVKKDHIQKETKIGYPANIMITKAKTSKVLITPVLLVLLGYVFFSAIAHLDIPSEGCKEGVPNVRM